MLPFYSLNNNKTMNKEDIIYHLNMRKRHKGYPKMPKRLLDLFFRKSRKHFKLNTSKETLVTIGVRGFLNRVYNWEKDHFPHLKV